MWKWIKNEIKANAFRYVVDLTVASIILLYTLHRIDIQYNNIQKKVDDIYSIVSTTVKSQAEKVDSAGTLALQDFKDKRKDIYNKVYQDGKQGLHGILNRQEKK